MTYLLSQIVLCLLAALAVGGFLGWWIQRSAAQKAAAGWQDRLDESERERERLSAELQAREATLAGIARDQDRARVESKEAERDLSVIIGERDRALTRAVGLQEEVEALAEAFRERNEAVRRLQEKLDKASDSASIDTSQEILRLRTERDRLKRLLDENTS